MGRGSGMDQFATANKRKRKRKQTSKSAPKPSAATLGPLGVEANPKRQQAPGDPLVRFPGYMLNDGTVATFLNAEPVGNLTFPSLIFKGKRIYPAGVPSERQQFIGACWDLWRTERHFDAEDLSKALWEKGVGTRQLGRKGKGAAISEEDLRAEMYELIFRMRLPIVGYTLAHNRDEVGAGVAELQSRVEQMTRASDALENALADGAWWSDPVSRDARISKARGSRYSEDVMERALTEMMAKPIKAKDLARLLSGIDERRAWKTTDIRQLNFDLRMAGVPVVSTNNGSFLADTPGDLKAYLEKRRTRIEETRMRARILEVVGSVWYPETPEEHAAAQNACKKTWEAGPSPRAKRLAQEKARRAEERNEEKELEKEAAAARIKAAWADPKFKDAYDRKTYGQKVSDVELRRLRSVADDSYFLKHGRKRPRKRRRGRNGQQSSRPIASSRSASELAGTATPRDVVRPTPWER